MTPPPANPVSFGVGHVAVAAVGALAVGAALLAVGPPLPALCAAAAAGLFAGLATDAAIDRRRLADWAPVDYPAVGVATVERRLAWRHVAAASAGLAGTVAALARLTPESARGLPLVEVCRPALVAVPLALALSAEALLRAMSWAARLAPRPDPVSIPLATPDPSSWVPHADGDWLDAPAEPRPGGDR